MVQQCRQACSIHAQLNDRYDDKIVSWRYFQEENIRQEGWWSQRLLTSTALRHECDIEVLDHDGMSRQESIWVPCSDSQRYVHDDPDCEWELLPECRKCYQVFKTREELLGHLERKPSHRIPFARKTYNTLHPRAEHGGDRKCFTCGKTYHLHEKMHEHNVKEDHLRGAMIPRWKQDNHWFDRRHSNRKAGQA